MSRRVATIFHPFQATNVGALGPSHLGTEDGTDLGSQDMAAVWWPLRSLNEQDD